MKHWRLVFAVLIGTAIVIAVSALGATSGATIPYDPDRMASWLQAIGGVGAIAGAFALANRQRLERQREAKLAQEEDFKYHAEAVKHVIDDATRAVKAASKYIARHQPGKRFSMQTRRLESSADAIKVFIGKPLPPQLLPLLLEMQKVVGYSITSLRSNRGSSVVLKNATRERASGRATRASEIQRKTESALQIPRVMRGDARS